MRNQNTQTRSLNKRFIDSLYLEAARF